MTQVLKHMHFRLKGRAINHLNFDLKRCFDETAQNHLSVKLEFHTVIVKLLSHEKELFECFC